MPIGGGGHISGIAVAAAQAKPGVEIIGVEAEGAASTKLSRERGKVCSLERTGTIADGINVIRPGEMTFDIMQRHVSEIITVTDEEITGAVLLLLERAKIVTEGAGAASLAAMLYHRARLRNRTVVAVISGGNIDANFMSRIIEKGLVHTGRRLSLSTVLPDRPGNLQRFLARVAACRANVLSVIHDRLEADIPLNEVKIGVVLETEGVDHTSELIRNLQSEGYGVRVVGRAGSAGQVTGRDRRAPRRSDSMSGGHLPLLVDAAVQVGPACGTGLIVPAVGPAAARAAPSTLLLSQPGVNSPILHPLQIDQHH